MTLGDCVSNHPTLKATWWFHWHACGYAAMKTIIIYMYMYQEFYATFQSISLDLIMVAQVVSSSSSCLVKSSTPTTACLSTLPTTPTWFRSVPPPRSSTTTWSGSDLLVGSLVWSSPKDSYWMCSSQGLSINPCSASEFMLKHLLERRTQGSRGSSSSNQCIWHPNLFELTHSDICIGT